jgi:hypothetical protein
MPVYGSGWRSFRYYAGVRLSLALGHHVAQESKEQDERHSKDNDHNQRTNNPFLGPPAETPLGSVALRSRHCALLAPDRGRRGKESAPATAAAKRLPPAEAGENVHHARAPRPTNFAAAANGTGDHEGLA